MIYDYIVDINGLGDYTEIATCIAAAGQNKSIFVKHGTYSETDDVIPLNGQHIYFDNTIINFATGKHLNMISTTNSSLDGYLVINGDGVNCRLLDCRGNNNKCETCIITLDPTASLAMVADTRIVFIAGSFNSFTLRGANITLTSSNAAFVGSFVSLDCSYSLITVGLDGLTLLGATGAAVLNGLDTYNDYNIYKFIISNVTTTTGNTGKGVKINAGSDYNQAHGVARNCDSANFTNSGTGNNVAAVCS
jgi:hypothetical protein